MERLLLHEEAKGSRANPLFAGAATDRGHSFGPHVLARTLPERLDGAEVRDYISWCRRLTISSQYFFTV